MTRGLLTLGPALSLLLAVGGCTEDDERTLLNWSDPQTGTNFRVTVRPTLVKTNSRLYVEGGRVGQSIVIDDDANWGTIRFVRYEDWLLVFSDQYVLAGYRYTSKKLFGENDWKSLPFTVRSSAGAVVARREVGNTTALPVNFPRVPEPEPQGAAVTR